MIRTTIQGYWSIIIFWLFVIMQNGIFNAWQLLKFYHAAIIGAYIFE